MNYTKNSVTGIRLAIVLFWVVLIFSTYYISQYFIPINAGRTLYIAAWPLSLDAQYLVDFEQKTGINIKITYFESSEELLSKIKTTEGMGYDIIFPSDYTVKELIGQGLLQKIDKSKLNFLNSLDTRLLNSYFDPSNDYTIPFYWAAYGIGVNKKLFGAHPPHTLGLLFDSKYNPERIIMTNSPREAILIAGLYLFGSVNQLGAKDNQQRIKDLLLQQKSWVDLYTEERLDELLASENNMLAFGLSPDITRAIRKNKDIIFMVPDEGSFIVIDSVAIPARSKNTELVYEFLNYLYQPQVVDHHIELYNMCSPITTNTQVAGYAPNDQEFKKLHFLIDIICQTGLNTIWIDLLAH